MASIDILGYSLCKIVKLGQEIKLDKTYQKLFYRNIIFILWKVK